MSSLNVLLVDDEPDMLRTCSRIISDIKIEGVQINVETEQDSFQGSKRLEAGEPDIAIFDIKMPGMTGLELLEIVKNRGGAVTCVLMTGYPTVETAIEAMRLGAFDYLVKPFSSEQFEIVFRRAADRRLLQEENRFLRDQVIQDSDITAESAPMLDVLSLMQRIAKSDSSVLITGETGTGKTLLAKRIHRLSSRRPRNFVHIDCGALPEHLLESELFGHERGAFTGAATARKGLVEFANGGSIVFDDVCNLPASMQAKLLGVLQERKCRRVGSNKSVDVDVRVIAATNNNTEEEVRSGRFREDLYFRLNVLRIHVPPLRARQDDILPLARLFLQRCGVRLSGKIRELSKEAEEALLSYRFPGNVRELENVIERACALSQSGKITAEDFPKDVLVDVGVGGDPMGEFSRAREECLERFERVYFTRLLEDAESNVTRASKKAGLSRNTIYRYLKKLGLSSGEDL